MASTRPKRWENVCGLLKIWRPRKKIFTRPKENGQSRHRYGFISYTFITGRTTTNFTDYIKFRVPVHLMMGVISRKFSRESQLNNNCKTLFHSIGVALKGDAFSCINLPENSKLIQRFTATLSDAKKRTKKMYVDSLAPGTVTAIVLLRYTSSVCATTTPLPLVSHQSVFIPTDKVHIWCQELVPSLAQRGEGGGGCDLPLARARYKSLLCGLLEGRLCLQKDNRKLLLWSLYVGKWTAKDLLIKIEIPISKNKIIMQCTIWSPETTLLL